MTAENSHIAKPKQGKKPGIGFMARLFCVN